jgi:hypothetical protein
MDDLKDAVLGLELTLVGVGLVAAFQGTVWFPVGLGLMAVGFVVVVVATVPNRVADPGANRDS